MRELSRYSLVDHDRENGRAALARDGRPLPLVVDGAVLEAQFELSGGGSLIWLTDDSPYDEGLHVYLLGPDDALEDALEAGADFAAGLLKIMATGEDWAEFAFFLNQKLYRLEVKPAAGIKLRLPAGWKYKTWLSRHRLAVREAGQGEM